MIGTGLTKYLPEFMVPLKYWLTFKLHYALAKTTRNGDCPICGCRKAKIFSYGKDPYATGSVLRLDVVSKGHDKYCCSTCGHFYALWLRKSTGEVADLYSDIYSGDSEVYTENDRKDIQKEMMRIARETWGAVDFSVLDYGCGPNYKAAYEMRTEGMDAYCSDILPKLPYDDKVFLKFDERSGETLRGRFSAITSVDVLEHLNTPVDDFKRFNRMLKPGGVMVHFTPMLSHFSVFGSHADHVFHTNFFSTKSLALTCEKTAFKLEAKVVEQRGYRSYYVFRKVGEALP